MEKKPPSESSEDPQYAEKIADNDAGSPQWVHGLLPPRGEYLQSNRPDLLARLKTQLLPHNSFRSAAVWAPTGSLHDSLALEYAHHRRDTDPSCSIFWVRGNRLRSFLHSYELLAKQFNIGNEFEGSELLAAVRDRIQAEPQWLLVISNVLDLSLFSIRNVSGMYTSMLPYIPKSDTGGVLWTTTDEEIFKATTTDVLGIQDVVLATTVLVPPSTNDQTQDRPTDRPTAHRYRRSSKPDSLKKLDNVGIYEADGLPGASVASRVRESTRKADINYTYPSNHPKSERFPIKDSETKTRNTMQIPERSKIVFQDTNTLYSSHETRDMKSVQTQASSETNPPTSPIGLRSPVAESQSSLLSSFMALAQKETRKALKEAARGTGGPKSPEARARPTVDLSRQSIEDLPEEFVDIVNQGIELLALSNNFLSSLPTRFSECCTLRYLNLRSNRFREFPMPICDLDTLEILDLSRNKLTSLPPEIAKLVALKVLAVKKNRISELPPALADMPCLQVLKFEANPITFPPQQVLQVPEDHSTDSPLLTNDEMCSVVITKQIRDYLRDYSLQFKTSQFQATSQSNALGKTEAGQFDYIEPNELDRAFEFPRKPPPIPIKVESPQPDAKVQWAIPPSGSPVSSPRAHAGESDPSNRRNTVVQNQDDDLITESEARELLSGYLVVRLQKTTHHYNTLPRLGDQQLESTWEVVERSRHVNGSSQDLSTKIRGLERTTSPVFAKLARLPPEVKSRLEMLRWELEAAEKDQKYIYTLAQLEPVEKRPRIPTDKETATQKAKRLTSRDRFRLEIEMVRAYFKREPRPNQDVRKMLEEHNLSPVASKIIVDMAADHPHSINLDKVQMEESELDANRVVERLLDAKHETSQAVPDPSFRGGQPSREYEVSQPASDQVLKDYLLNARANEDVTSPGMIKIFPQAEVHEAISNAKLGFSTDKEPSVGSEQPTIVDYVLRDEVGSVKSVPQSSLFSKATRPTTIASSKPTTQKEDTTCQLLNLAPTPTTRNEDVKLDVDPKGKSVSTKAIEGDTTNSDAETSYSVDSVSDDINTTYLRSFCDQLTGDLTDMFDEFEDPFIDKEKLEEILKIFSWRLHEESRDPFQWEASVTLHKKRREIIKLLSQGGSPEVSSAADQTSGSEGEEPERLPFQKPSSITLNWVKELDKTFQHSKTIDAQPFVEEDVQSPSQQNDYETFVHESGAYQWLLSTIRQGRNLTCDGPSAMSAITREIQGHLKKQGLMRKLSRRRPPSAVSVIFNLEWNPAKVLHEHEIPTVRPRILNKVLCFTGSLLNAQAMTVVEYMRQTWPQTWEHLAMVISKLMSLPTGEECSYKFPKPPNERKSDAGTRKREATKSSLPRPILRARMTSTSSCSVTVTGGSYLVCEIAEQLAWLGATLRSPPSSMSGQGVVTCTPSVKNIRKPSDELFWVCDMVFDMKQNASVSDRDGSCWAQLFWNPILVEGYPILARSEPDTGLEMSLGVISLLTRSSQVVLWDRRVVIKGFNALVVATQITTGLVLWHLLTSADPEARISYIEPELDELAFQLPEEFSLRTLDGSRHIVGWCSKATDWCGHAGTNLNIGASGLQRPPPSIVIDRLYLEAGNNIIGGLNMSFNKKEKPFWLEREKDYPSLLKWVSLQPVIFYDVSSQRAWLIDGASALLQLVRISLYVDEQDPESTYDWVFDSAKLKDKWDNVSGRLAALKTLKSWDNLGMNLYVTERKVRHGETFTEYSTLETRVKKILHSIELLIDRQVRVASQDGITIAQTFDLRKTIAGFDIMDIISPLGPIHPRIKQLEFMAAGWQDLVSAIGITTIFGRGFGELIRPDEPSAVCRKWSTVPTGSDFLAASVSTLKMLHERRLTRMWPDLAIGEFTAKIIWLASAASLKLCDCVGTSQNQNQSQSHSDCHSSPVQFMISKKSLTARFRSKAMTPVDFASLDTEGAIIFGPLPFPGPRRDNKETKEERRLQESDELSTGGLELSSIGESSSTLSQSASGSAVGSSMTQPTTLTSSSAGSGSLGVVDGNNSQEALGTSSPKPSNKRTWLFKRIRDKTRMG